MRCATGAASGGAFASGSSARRCVARADHRNPGRGPPEPAREMRRICSASAPQPDHGLPAGARPSRTTACIRFRTAGRGTVSLPGAGPDKERLAVGSANYGTARTHATRAVDAAGCRSGVRSSNSNPATSTHPLSGERTAVRPITCATSSPATGWKSTDAIRTTFRMAPDRDRPATSTLASRVRAGSS
jgi:hypothetical protein